MEKVRKTLSLIAPAFPLKPMIQLSGQKLVFPLYHAVNDHCPIHLKHLYKIRKAVEFENDLDELCRFFEPLSPEILSDSEKLSSRSKPGFILSFDDGLREIIEVVEPILQRKGINAIFFLNNSFIDNTDMFFRYKASVLCETILNAPEHSIAKSEIAHILGHKTFNKRKVISSILNTGFHYRARLDIISILCGFDFTKYLSEVRPYLTTPEIAELQKKGYFIGAHSFNHPLFTDLTDEQMITEVSASMEDIEKRFNPPLKFFAFPFTDGGIPSKVINDIFQNNPVAIFGSAGIKMEKHSNHYQRIPFEKSEQSVSNYLKTEYLYYILKAGFGRNSIRR
jgi:peptidoglycan/xylan/chitin deacetylase (PgdA/CDA1 family)